MFGFSFNGGVNKPISQYIFLFFETLSNHSMKPFILMSHFNTKHENLKNKPLKFFKYKESELKANKGPIASFTCLNARSVEASYKIRKNCLGGKTIYHWRNINFTRS